MKVTDLRTGLEHPTRNSLGQFVSPQTATRQVEILSRTQDRATRNLMEACLVTRADFGYYNHPSGYIAFHIRGRFNHKVN